MPDYELNDPRGWCGDIRRGAALGRRELFGDPEFSGRIYLRKVRLDSGGYDTNGTYFGIGAPLYWYASADGDIDGVLRAADRASARAKVLEQYPRAVIER